MISILGIASGLKNGIVWLLDALPASIKWLLFVIALLSASNTYTYYHVKNATEKRITDKYNEMLSGMRRLNSVAVAQQGRDMEALAKELEGKRKELEEARKRYNTLQKEIPKYVTEKANAMCVITSGFERVFNASATGAELEVAGSGTMDVDSPSAFTISDVAKATAENNAECLERGRVIEAWQLWYHKSKDSFNRAQAIANGNPKEALSTE